MKLKNIFIVAMVIIAIILFWNQSQVNPSLWIKIIGIILFFIGMAKLSEKTPSKNQENENKCL